MSRDLETDIEEEDAEETVEEESGSKVRQRYKNEYAARGNARHCSDDFAELFNAAVLDYGDGEKTFKRPILNEPALKKIAVENGIDYDRYSHLNNGMKRMNVGNALRGMLRRGNTIWWPNHQERLTPSLAGFDQDDEED
jgi:hypothetical protein